MFKQQQYMDRKLRCGFVWEQWLNDERHWDIVCYAFDNVDVIAINWHVVWMVNSIKAIRIRNAQLDARSNTFWMDFTMFIFPFEIIYLLDCGQFTRSHCSKNHHILLSHRILLPFNSNVCYLAVTYWAVHNSTNNKTSSSLILTRRIV